MHAVKMWKTIIKTQSTRIGIGTSLISYPIYIYNYYSIAGYKITYFVATLSYDNYYINL